MSTATITTMLNFTYMGFSLKPKMQHSLGRYLKEFRENYKDSSNSLSSTEVAKRAGISQGYISRIEDEGIDGTIKDKWQPRKQLALLLAYGLSESEIIEASKHFGLDAHSVLNTSLQSPPIPETIARKELVAIRDLGTIQAGLKGLSFSNDSYEYTNVLADDLNGYNPENCFRVTISGDSMVSDEVARRIMPGSKAIFHILTPKMQPREGDVIAAWLTKQDIGVIKTYHKTDDYIILNSYNKHHRPIIIDNEDELKIQGILVSVTQMYRQ